MTASRQSNTPAASAPDGAQVGFMQVMAGSRLLVFPIPASSIIGLFGSTTHVDEPLTLNLYSTGWLYGTLMSAYHSLPVGPVPLCTIGVPTVQPVGE